MAVFFDIYFFVDKTFFDQGVNFSGVYSFDLRGGRLDGSSLISFVYEI